MQTTPAQRTVLRVAAEAEPSLDQAILDGDDQLVANWFNGLAAPDFWVLKNRVSRHEIIAETSADGTSFAWAGAGYITRNQGERDAFREMFNSTGEVDPRKPSIQAAFVDIFSGSGNAAANRAHISAVSRRKATRAEKLLADTSGGKVGTAANPAWMTADGEVSTNDVSQIMRPT